MNHIETIVEKLTNVKSHLYKLWEEIGLTENEKENKITILTSNLLEQVKCFEDEEKSLRQNQIKIIDDTALKLYHLTNDLKIDAVAEPEGHLTLRQLEKYLKSQLVIYQEEEQNRTSKLKLLRQRESELCRNLDEKPTLLPADRIPTYESLDFLKKSVNSLENEYINREKSFISYKASILAHMEELNAKPSTSLERDLLSNVEGLVTLSQKNLYKMKTLSKDMQLKVQQQREKEEFLKDQINLLWDRLSVDEERKENFLSSLSLSTAENIIMLESELRELQELKLQNLGCFINKIRRELEEWWDKCYISEDEKESFEPYVSEEYSDDILEAHEKEVQKLKNFYSQNEQIFLKINKWEKVWQTLTELEEKVNDPGRLFKNRGCALLQEEKERKRVNNELPRIERDIEERISVWEKENRKPFLICGNPFQNFIQYNWHSYNEKKNREKQVRMETRSKQIQKEAVLGTRKASPSKRNLLRSDSLQVTKFLRTNESQRTPSSSTSTLGSSFVSSKYNYVKSPKNISKIQTRKRQIVRPMRKEMASFNSTEMSSYNKFSEGIEILSERENIRSSVGQQNNLCYKSPNVRSKAWPNYFAKSPASASKVQRFTPLKTPRLQPLSPSNRQIHSSVTSFSRRRSARLNPVLSGRTLLMSGMRSPKPPSGQARLTTPIRNKLNILM